MSDRLFYGIALSCATGIFLRTFFESLSIFSYALLACALGLLMYWYVCRNAHVLLAGVIILGFSLGVIRFDGAEGEVNLLFEERVDTAVEVEGVIVREVDERENTTHLTVSVESLDGVSARERVLVLTERFPKFSYGDRVVVSATIEKPEAFETELGRTFNYSGYLSARGITYTMPFARVEKIGEGEGNILLAYLLHFKYAFMGRVEALIPEPHAGLAEGLVLGVKRALGVDLERAFRIAGIIHIVVLSGYNVTIVAEAIMRLLSYFFMPRTRVIAGALAIVLFALIAGFSATVVRASLMALLVLVARATGRIYDVVRGLVLAGLVMLLFNPMLLVYDPGFQLSFLATLGLIVLAPLIESRLALVPTRFQIREFITATIATQIFVLPLLLYSMGEFSLVAIVVNVLVLPVVPFAMLLTFLSGMVGFISTALAVPVAYGAYLLLGYIILVAEWFAALPFAALSVPAFPFWVTLIAYAILAYAMFATYRRLARKPSKNAPPRQTSSHS